MPEMRQNRFTKEWVVIATERAKRPEELKTKRTDIKPLPKYSPTCPFCPGNEAMSPGEVMRLNGADGSWRVKVVPNKFAALSREGEPTRKVERSKRTINGVGIHDVILESPDHSATTALLSDEQVTSVLTVYKQRYDEISRDPRITQVTIFKNYGAAAGASLEHPHSQLIASPVISHQVRDRMYEALRHYDEFGECIFCQVNEEEIEEKTRTVMLTDHFLVLEPFASSTPFTTHIFPRRHMASFGEINAQELADLGHTLRVLLGKLYVGLENPDFNYTVRTAPAENAGAKYYHWYISVIPRLTRVAGFELGSGMFINTVLPEVAAEFLRGVNADQKIVTAAG
jgi:UDPglucose--hexose-1-phosphate uridylyltransferase